MATLTLCPDLSENPNNFNSMELPLMPTRGSILRCLEFARMRWHSAISLNYYLDQLITDIVERKNSEGILPAMETLIKLRLQAAIHLEDPLSYLWDATVGSEIARTLHSFIIEEIESTIFKKFEMAKRIMEEQVEILKTKDLLSLLEIKKITSAEGDILPSGD